MTVYIAWTSADLGQLEPPRDLAGPWREVVVATAGLAFVDDSDETLSATGATASATLSGALRRRDAGDHLSREERRRRPGAVCG